MDHPAWYDFVIARQLLVGSVPYLNPTKYVKRFVEYMETSIYVHV
jgi:hypothetical protein